MVADFVQPGQRCIESDALIQQQSVCFPVFCNIGKTCVDGRFRIFQVRLLSEEVQFTADIGTVTPAENRHGKLRASGTLQAGETDNFSLVHFE